MVFTIIVFIYVLQIKNKQALHFMFIFTILCILIWNINISIVYLFFQNKINEHIGMVYLGICLLPPFFLLTAYFFAHSNKYFRLNQIVIFFVPLLTLILAFTNTNHNLLMINQAFILKFNKYGPYFPIHSIYSYGCIILAIYYLISFAIKNSGFFSKQAILIMIGSAITLVINILGTVKFIDVSQFDLCISFSFTIFFYWLAIIKYDFLNIMPIALQHVVDHISDGLLVLNKDYLLIDFNTAAETMFSKILILNKKENIFKIAQKINLLEEDFRALLGQVANENRTIAIENKIRVNDFDKYFSIDLTPMYSRKKYIGTIILFKDITEHKQNIVALESKNKELDDANAELQVQNEKIQELNIKLKRLSEIDVLTGVYNRRFFNEYYENEIIRVLNQGDLKQDDKYKMNFGIAILDIDNFKKVNDKYGHMAGDSVLKQFAQIIKTATLSRDIVCRYGGEEFVIIFTKISREKAIRTAEKIRVEVEKHQFLFNEEIKDVHITVSIGFASFDEDCGTEKNNVLMLADERLYNAKTTSKNKVIFE
ncbi:MAG: diguanylate cyclase [Clostridium sp.]|nr:diguanylate cyclase [Clostridium sp.]